MDKRTFELFRVYQGLSKNRNEKGKEKLKLETPPAAKHTGENTQGRFLYCNKINTACLSNLGGLFMGLGYKCFQKLAYWSLEYYREEGIRINKQREREMQRIRQEKHDKEMNEVIGINWANMNRVWNDALRDDEGVARGKAGRSFE